MEACVQRSEELHEGNEDGEFEQAPVENVQPEKAADAEQSGGERRQTHMTLLPPLSAEAAKLAEVAFERFCEAKDMPEIMAAFNQLCDVLNLAPNDVHSCFPMLRARLRSWKARSLLSKLEKKAAASVYRRGRVAEGARVLVVGAGPCGLRTAIECALLGARCCVVEKRTRYTRNNVVHIWPFVIADLKALGAKSFYGRFAAGSIDHISIKRLETILLKVALLLGVDVQSNVTFVDVVDSKCFSATPNHLVKMIDALASSNVRNSVKSSRHLIHQKAEIPARILVNSLMNEGLGSRKSCTHFWGFEPEAISSAVFKSL